MKHSKKTELELSRKYREAFDLHLPGMGMHAKSLQPCLTLCNPMHHSSVHGILQEEYWSGLPCPSPGIFPAQVRNSSSLMSPALAGGFFTTSATWEAHLSGTFS